MTIIKTLLGLQKTTEISTSQPPPDEKFASLFSLILAKFTPEMTADIMRKSASLFASNPKKMGEWVSFLQASFSNLVYHGAETMLELTECEKLNEFLVKKYKHTRNLLLELSRDDEILKHKAEADRRVRDHFIRRLNELEFISIEQMSTISRLTQERAVWPMQELEVDKFKFERSLAEKEEAYNRDKRLLASEVRRHSQLQAHSELQKAELLGAFKDFQLMFESFKLEVS
jgi:hypothetical protein